MADETNSVAEIAETATAIAAQAEQRAEIAEEQRDAAIEQAAAERAAAQDVAADMARAAMDNEQGRRIEGVERGLSECQSRMTGLETTLNEIRNLIAQPPAVAVISPAPASTSLTPPLSEGQQMTQVETLATEISPAESESAEGPATQNAPQEAPRKRRRLL